MKGGSHSAAYLWVMTYIYGSVLDRPLIRALARPATAPAQAL